MYNRQNDKQLLADRVLDFLNPDSQLYAKDLRNLIEEDEDDLPPIEFSQFQTSDPILKCALNGGGRWQKCL